MHPGTTLTPADEGKAVVDGRGAPVGRVVDVEQGVAYVEPAPDLAESLMAELGWVTRDAETFPLQRPAVEAIESDVIRISAIR